jgi:uncharacterized tellurite resistance protein B-like protein
MFDALHRLLTGLDHPQQAAEQNDSAFALAVLLIEVARSSDNRLEDREEGVIERALARRFNLEQEQVILLVKAAEEGAIQATDLFHFTQVVVDKFGEEGRIGVIEMLWEVAYADGVLTGDEDTLIRRVAGLIGWLETNGAIIFSQYRATAEWVAEALCAVFPDEPVAMYAGGSASFVQRGSDRRSAGREQIKASVQLGDIRLVCATDAACEGLNLQRLGAQVNVDLPWNPSRLEQRKGRVQRIGQVRDDIHVLSLRYAGTVEDDVYRALSERFGDIFSVLGQLPEGFEDDWIDAVIRDRAAVRNFSQRIERAKPPMELRYLRDVADDHGLDWEYTQRVLSSRDLDEWMRQGW